MSPNIEQRENLLKVADFIEQLPPYALNMNNYVVDPGCTLSGEPLTKPSVDCGSVCCILGWTPSVIDCQDCFYTSDVGGARKEPYFSYDEISEKKFGIEHYGFVWLSLFSAKLDPDPKLRAQAIRDYVEMC